MNVDADDVKVGGDVVGHDKKIEAETYIEQATFITPAPIPAPVDEVPAPGEAPFKGLQYFDVGDADLFFGREALTAKLVGHLHEHPFLAVIGASGSGKSSLVRAGLIPALQRGEPLADGTLPPDGSARWPVHVITPTVHPLEALASSLTRDSESVTATSTLIDDLARDPRSLHLAVRRILSRGESATRPYGDRLLLVVDQFEELFTACKDESMRQAFVDNLMTAVGAPSPSQGEGWGGGDGPTVIVLTLRADFYDHCAPFDALREALARRQEYIGPMSADELRRAIEEPARRNEWDFEPGLVDLLLRDVGDEPGALPLLSHALLETWKRRRGRLLTLEGYEASGGVRGAIARTAEAVFRQLRPEQQAIARSIFLRLTELGEGTQDTRRRAALSELMPRAEDRPSVEAVLKTLADARLIATAGEAAEVAHEALIREWPRLREWLDEDREGLRLHRHLTEAAQEWAKMARDPGELYRGARLAQASEWTGDHADEMNALEHEFLDASRALQVSELEATKKVAVQLRNRARYLAGALIVALVMGVAAGVANIQSNDLATRNSEIASTAQAEAVRAEKAERLARIGQLAAQSQATLEQFPQRSLLLAIEALNVTSQVGESRVAAAEDTLRRTLSSTGGIPLRGHEGTVNAVAFSPDGRWLATGSFDETARLWDVSSPAAEPVVLRGHEDNVVALAFSPDGHWLATGSFDKTARLWDVSNPAAAPVVLRGHNNRVVALAFSPDGRWLATAGSRDNTARLWDVSNPNAAPVVLRGHEGGVVALAFSPDGRWLATASEDATVRLRDVTNLSAAPVVLRGHEGGVVALAFSPDGRWLATASEDDTARLWDVSNPSADPFVLRGHEGGVQAVEFSPDGTLLATEAKDATGKIWDVSSGEELFALTGLIGPVAAIAFSPDGTQLVTESGNNVVMWDLTTGQKLLTLHGHEDAVVALAFSPDGRWLATGSRDDTARLWDVSNPAAEPVVLRGHEDNVVALAFSPDGHWLATGSEDATARLWDVSNPNAAPFVLRGHEDRVVVLVFSPDGHWLATGSWDDTARLWDVTKPSAAPVVLRGHEGIIEALAFSPDGRWLATGSEDATARLWDVTKPSADPFALRALRGHGDDVVALAFSPDGRWLATGSWDDTARLWDVSNPSADPFVLRGHESVVEAVTFSPDGRWLATGSWDDTARLWDVSNPSAAPIVLRGHEDGVRAVAFSPDGRWLATGSEDGTARLWNMRLDELIDLACRTVGRNMTLVEWEQYFPGQPSRKTCQQWPEGK